MKFSSSPPHKICQISRSYWEMVLKLVVRFPIKNNLVRMDLHRHFSWEKNLSVRIRWHLSWATISSMGRECPNYCRGVLIRTEGWYLPIRSTIRSEIG